MTTESPTTEQFLAGMAWWNSLSVPARLYWLKQVGGNPTAEDAYRLWLERQEREGEE